MVLWPLAKHHFRNAQHILVSACNESNEFDAENAVKFIAFSNENRYHEEDKWNMNVYKCTRWAFSILLRFSLLSVLWCVRLFFNFVFSR